MSPEARVGLVTLLALLLLFAAVVFLRGQDFFRPPGYELTVLFTNAAGVDMGTPVRMSGVTIGKVKAVALSPTNEAHITISVNGDVRIPQGSRFLIATTGLIGERYVAVTPGPAGATPIPPNSELRGEDPFSVERLAERFEEVADRVSTLVENANNLITDPQLRADLRQALQNAREATAVARQALTEARDVVMIARRAAANVEQTTRRVQALVNSDAVAIAENLRRMSLNLVETSERLQAFIENTAGDGTLSRDIRETAAMLRDASQRIRQMAEDLQGVINKENVAKTREVIDEARETVREARAVVRRAGSFLGPVDSSLPQGGLSLRNFVGVEYQVWYTGQRAGHGIDFTVLPNAARFYRLGLHDIGATNTLVLQIGGRLNPSLAWRAGVFESQVGVGLDYRISKPLWLSLDLYNMNQVTLDALGRYQLTPDWRITLGGRNLLRQPTFVLGVGRNF